MARQESTVMCKLSSHHKNMWSFSPGLVPALSQWRLYASSNCIHVMTNDKYKRHGGQIRRALDLACTSDWTMNSISGLWSLRALPSLMIAFGSNLSKGWRMLTIEADRVLDWDNRVRRFVGTFSRYCFRVAAQVWLWEWRGPCTPRT